MDCYAVHKFARGWVASVLACRPGLLLLALLLLKGDSKVTPVCSPSRNLVLMFHVLALTGKNFGSALHVCKPWMILPEWCNRADRCMLCCLCSPVRMLAASLAVCRSHDLFVGGSAACKLCSPGG